jgi:hypothetical protein
MGGLMHHLLERVQRKKFEAYAIVLSLGAHLKGLLTKDTRGLTIAERKLAAKFHLCLRYLIRAAHMARQDKNESLRHFDEQKFKETLESLSRPDVSEALIEEVKRIYWRSFFKAARQGIVTQIRRLTRECLLGVEPEIDDLIWRCSDAGFYGLLVFSFPRPFLNDLTERLKKVLGGDDGEVDPLVEELYKAFRLIRGLKLAERDSQLRDPGVELLVLQLKFAIYESRMNESPEAGERKRNLLDACKRYVREGKVRELTVDPNDPFMNAIRASMFGTRANNASSFANFVAGLLGIGE